MKAIFRSIVAIIALGMVWAAPTQAALVGHWTFNEAGGDTVPNSSGNGNDGAINGATRVPGQPGFGGALSFDGVSNEVLINNNAALNFAGSTQFTAMAWYNPSGASGGVCCGQIVGQRTAGNWVLRDDNRDPNQIEMLVSPGFPGDGGFDGVPQPPIGEWHHIAAVVDKPNVMIYTDGVLGVTYSVGNADPMAGAGTPTRIGGAPDGFVNGLIDDVKIFDHALTEEEVRAAMAVIPEPTTFALAAIGLVGLLGFNRRRRRQ